MPLVYWVCTVGLEGMRLSSNKDLIRSKQRATLVVQMVKNPPTVRETWAGKIPWRRAWQPAPVLLPGESRGQSLTGCSPWHRRESDTTEWLSTAQRVARAFLGGASGGESVSAGEVDLIPGSRKFPGERHGNPLQYSCFGNHIDRGTWLATAHGVPKNQTKLCN